MPQAAALGAFFAVLRRRRCSTRQFIAHEYVAPLSSCVHLLTPVGRAPKVVKRGDVWELQKPARRRKKKGEAEAPAPLDEDIAEAAEAREDFALTEGQAAALACVDACVTAAPARRAWSMA